MEYKNIKIQSVSRQEILGKGKKIRRRGEQEQWRG